MQVCPCVHVVTLVASDGSVVFVGSEFQFPAAAGWFMFVSWAASTWHDFTHTAHDGSRWHARSCRTGQDRLFYFIIQQQQQSFYGPLSGSTRVSRYQKKRSPAHHPDHNPIFISFFRLLWSIASSLFKLRAWQSFFTTSVHVLFGLPFGLEPSTSYSIHFFTQSVFSFHNICPYHRNLFCCSINIISSIPSLCLNSLLGTLSFTLTLHIHLTILISARWSAISSILHNL